jgi:hypothetical protein
MTKPTQRTIAELKQLGFVFQVVEHWNAWARRRVDLFGIGDILAMREGIGLLLIQTTSGDNHAKRRTKAMAEPRLLTWLKCGGRFEIFSWAKRRSTDILVNGKRTRRKDWKLWRQELVLQDGAIVAREGFGDGGQSAGEMGRAA